MMSLLEMHPAVFARSLAETGGRRMALLGDDAGGLVAGDPAARPLAEAVGPLAELAGHEAVFLQAEPGYDALFAAFVHDTTRGQAQGGLRRHAYAKLRDLLRDGLRLSRAMTRKSALAGLWWGGGKGVIAVEGDLPPADREGLYRAYGRFVTSLAGAYVTAADVGTTPADMAAIHAGTRFVTCVPPDLGGSGEPGSWTAAGVLCAMRAALEATGAGALPGKRVVLQGAGSVGASLLEQLLEAGVGRVVVGEVSAGRRAALADRFGGAPVEIRALAPGDDTLLAEPCDVLAPCALGGVLGPKTIPTLRCRVVCGAANNPLEDELRDGDALAARGIAYVPDVIANRLGIVHCADEHAGSLPNDPAVARHLGDDWEQAIGPTVRRVLAHARREDVSPVRACHALADELAAVPHPLWPGRGRALVASVMAAGWLARAGEADAA